MARITKASLEEFAKEVAALEAAEATILSPEEMARYAGGRYGAYTSLGTSQSEHEAHALAGLGNDLLSTEVGKGESEVFSSSITTMNLDNKNNEQHNSGAFDPFRSQDGSSGYYYDCLWRCVSYIRNKDGSARDAANIAYRFYSLYEFQDADPSGYLASSGASTGRSKFEAFKELDLKTKEYDPNSDNLSIGVISDRNVEKIYGHCVEGQAHAVVIRPNADGSADFYDPQTGRSGTLPKGTYSDWKY
jgi:hypothetical protein